MATPEQWSGYLKLLDDLGRTIEKLTAIEQEKTAAVSNHSVKDVDDCMKREQALSLSVRGLDQRRERMLSQMELQGVPLNKLPDHAPDDIHLEVKAACETLQSRYRLFQNASQVARDTLECHLRAVEKAMADVPEIDRPPQADFRI